jgi:hypothetical protein
MNPLDEPLVVDLDEQDNETLWRFVVVMIFFILGFIGGVFVTLYVLSTFTIDTIHRI